MQKKIIALAIAAALTTPALALAEASLYGQANLSIDMVNDGASPSGSSNNMVSNSSRLGFKGSQDLGGGNSVVWQMEGTVGMDSGATTAGQLFDRDTYLGLANAGMGTVMLGRQDTPYTNSTRNLDLFADGTADNRTMMGGHDLRLSNVVAYASPVRNGMSVAVASMFGAENATAADTKGSAISLAGMYEQGPIYATVAYDKIKFGTVGDLAAAPFGLASGDESGAFKVGGSYTMNQFAVNAVIEKTTFTPAAGGGDQTGTNLYLGGKFNVSSTDAAKLAYAKHGATTGNADGASEFTVGYDHGMNKNTTVYALYSTVTNDTNGTSNTAITGADPSTLSVGIKYAF